ncbi:MAG: hypothetical protein ABI840_11210 [bacterium]
MEKKFDAVKSMREIREKLNKEYSENPELRKKRLDIIHKKYELKNQISEIQILSDGTKKKLYGGPYV